MWSESQRAEIIAQTTGKTVASLEYSEGDEETFGNYWVMTFADDTEISFRFMAEIVRES